MSAAPARGTVSAVAVQVRASHALLVLAVCLLAGCAAGGGDQTAASGSASPAGSPTSPPQPIATPVGPQVPLPGKVSGKARAYPPRVSDVAIVGDSLTVGAQPYLTGDFAEVGSQVSYLKAQSGIPTSLGLSYLRNHADELPQTVILALGTNDVTAEPADVVDWLNRAREIIGPDRRLVWVNLSMANQEFPNDDVVNAALAQAAARDPRLLVLDWAGYTKANRIGNAVDGVHYSDADYARRAQFYTCAVVASPQCQPFQLAIGNEAVTLAPEPSAA